MKKSALVLAAAGLVGFAGAALADPDTTGNPGMGNQTCSYDSRLVAKNPGKYLQAMRNENPYGAPDGLNPKEWQDYWQDETARTVGEFILRDCGEPS